MPATYAARHGSDKPPAGFNTAQRQQSAMVSSSIPVPSADNASRKKSLLPQPRTVARVPPADVKKVQRPQQQQLADNPEPIKLRQETSKLQINTSPAEPSSEDAKQTSRATLPSQPRAERVVTRTRSKSPVKPQQNEVKPTAPVAAARKPSMPPLARPARSASLRQPSAPKLVSSAEAKGHTRHRSQVLSTARTTATQPIVPAAMRQQVEKANPPVKQPRPQFTTYQQNFSPKKEKDVLRTLPVADKKRGKSPQYDVASRPEVAGLQTELLQVGLLYASSLQQDREWKVAAEGQLREKFQSVAAMYRAASEKEHRIQEQLNLMALKDWSIDAAAMAENEHNGGTNFQAQIQTFSRICQEVADMTAETSGRYTLATEAFDEWLTRVESVRDTRNGTVSSTPNRVGTDEEEPQYIEALGQAWRDEIEYLTMKADLCLRELAMMTFFAINEDGFCQKHSSSALVKVARQYREILMLMVEELRTMRKTELETISLEKAWIMRAADQAVADHRQGESQSRSSRVAVWRSVAF